LETTSIYSKNIFETASKATNWPSTESRNQNAPTQGGDNAYASHDQNLITI